MPSPWKSPYCISPMNLVSSSPEALTSRAPVLQRIVALIHSGVPTAVTTPRAQRKLNTPAIQKMIFFWWFGMTRNGFGEDAVQIQDLCEHQEGTAPSTFMRGAEGTSWKSNVLPHCGGSTRWNASPRTVFPHPQWALLLFSCFSSNRNLWVENL